MLLEVEGVEEVVEVAAQLNCFITSILNCLHPKAHTCGQKQ